MPTYLDKILERKREDLKARKETMPLTRLQSTIVGLPDPLDFASALRRSGVQVIAEVKKASPSRGVMAGDLDPVTTAKTYAANGAAAISVLTEEPHFRGSIDFLPAIKEALGGGGPPLLRKDFILEAYQVYESRAYQADAVLLIAAALTNQELCDLLALSKRLGLQCLVEVHTVEEAHQAVASGAQVIGINNRDLHTFKTSLETTGQVRPHIPADRVVVSESGIATRQDVQRLAGWGVNALLIGEALVTAPDPGAKLRELLGR